MDKKDFFSNLLQRISPEGRHIINSLDVRTPSERAMDTLHEINVKNSVNTLEHNNIEVAALVSSEEKEIEVYKNLTKFLQEEHEILKCKLKDLQETESEDVLKKKIERSLMMLKGINPVEKVDLFEVINLHSEIQGYKAKVSQLEKELSKFHGLPPGKDEAKKVMENLRREINDLEIAAERNLMNDVAVYTK